MSFFTGRFSGNRNKEPSGEEQVVGAFDETVGALQRKEVGDNKKKLRKEAEKDEARAKRHDDLGGEYVGNQSKDYEGITTPGDPSPKGGGKKRRKSRRKKRRKSRSKRKKSRRKKRRKSRRKKIR